MTWNPYRCCWCPLCIWVGCLHATGTTYAISRKKYQPVFETSIGYQCSGPATASGRATHTALLQSHYHRSQFVISKSPALLIFFRYNPTHGPMDYWKGKSTRQLFDLKCNGGKNKWYTVVFTCPPLVSCWWPVGIHKPISTKGQNWTTDAALPH